MLSKVTATNFLSWENLEFNVQAGVTLVDGWNEDDQTSEGSGKSAVPNAICWAIYGKLPKDVNTDDVIKFGESDCSVVLEFSDGTKIVRSRKPNDLQIQIGGKTVKGKDARETQQLIQDYVGVTFESYCQSSYFAQNYAKKFLLSNQDEKGKILSDIQDISLFDKARKEVQDLLKLETDKVTTLTNSVKVHEATKAGLEGNIIMVETFIQQKIQQHDKTINDLRFKIHQANTNLQNQQANYNQLKVSLGQIDIAQVQKDAPLLEDSKMKLLVSQKEVQSIQAQADNLRRGLQLKQLEGDRYATKYKTLIAKKEQLLKFIENPTKNCPSCGTELKGQDTSHAQLEYAELEKEMALIVESLEGISIYLDSNKVESNQELIAKGQQIKESLTLLEVRAKYHKDVTTMFNHYTNQLQIATGSISNAETQKQNYEAELASQASPDLTQETAKLVAIGNAVSDAHDKIAQVTVLLNQTKHYASQLEQLKDGFKEIKSYVFTTALDELSFRANQFLSTLFEIPAMIEFSNEDLKIETKIKLNEQEMTIGLLSGGQFRRFSLAVDLALSDMVSSRKNSKVNMLVLDEYFKDLSEGSMEKCLELLKLRTCPVLLIEHNSIFKNIVDNVFFASLVNGTSEVSNGSKDL